MWRSRFCLILVVALAAGVALPPNQMHPSGGSGFPLAGLWDLLTTRPAWSYDQPSTPGQARGLGVDGEHGASGAATRVNGGVGRAPGKVPGALGEAVTPKPGDVVEHTTSAARKGFDVATSKRNAKTSSATTDVFENADGSLTQWTYPQAVNFQDAIGTWQPYNNRRYSAFCGPGVDHFGWWGQRDHRADLEAGGDRMVVPA